MTPEALRGKFVVGELHRGVAPEYAAEYDKLIESLRVKGGEA